MYVASSETPIGEFALAEMCDKLSAKIRRDAGAALAILGFRRARLGRMDLLEG